MGATITTGKRAAAFRTNAGDVRYVLYEQTYCKNTYPHTPRWECGAIGSVEQVLRYVFRGAADCEGGMLRSQSGPLTPEGYIAGWLVELAAPRRIVDREIPLEVSERFHAPIPAEAVDGALVRLRLKGHHELARKLSEGGRATVSLYGDIEALACIYDSAAIGPWRVLAWFEGDGPLDLRLGYTPARQRAPAVLPEMRRADDLVLLRDSAGNWTCAGKGFWAVKHFIREYVATEVAFPGSFRASIKQFRAASETAPACPQNTRLLFDPTRCQADWQRRQIAELPERFPTHATSSGVEIWWRELNQTQRGLIENYGAEQASWLFPDTETVATTQMDLLQAA